MTREEAWNRIDAIIEKHEVDDVYVTINNHKDYDALRFARKLLEQEPCEDAISRQAVLDIIDSDWKYEGMEQYINELPPVTPQPKTGWNNHQIACMLADLFGDVCACNYNGIDEWLGELCDFKDTCCPNPVGVACWEQFLKYSQSRYTECGYEVRDKNALQEPKTIQEKGE